MTQVGARLVLTCPPVLAGLRQAFIYVFGELKHTYTLDLHVCALNLGIKILKVFNQALPV